MNRFTAPRTGWGQRLIGVSAVGAVAAAVTLAGAPSVFAAENYLQFSLDGITFAPSISGPIFREPLTYVPGGETSSTVWIRNTSGETARLSSAAIMVRSDSQLNRQIGLTAGLDSDPGNRVALGSQGSCTNVSPVWDVGSGEELKLSLVVDLTLDAPNNTMNRTADFDVFFLLESQDAQQRTACEALSGPGELPSGLAAAPGMAAPAETDVPAASLAGTLNSGPMMASQPEPRRVAGEVNPGLRPPQDTIPMGPPVGITPAGFQSTVEPVIRSLSGTLLIAVAVLFAAAVVVRVREGRYE